MNKVLVLSLHLQFILLNKTVSTQQNYNYPSFAMDNKKCDQIKDVDSCFQDENISKWCDYEKILNLTQCYICEGKEYNCNNNNTIHVCSNINNITDICNKNSSNAQSPNESVLYDQNIDYYFSLDYLHIAIIVIVSLLLFTASSLILYNYYKKRSLRYAIVNINKV